jgi:predicted dehydrogenase
MASVVKVALAGISGYGDHYLGALLPNLRAKNFDFVGVVDPMPQRCRRLSELATRGIPLHETLDGLFCSTAVDLMLIVTPTHLHAPQTCMALSHGANVLCEKPVAGTVADAMRMLELQRTVKGFAAIGYQWSFSDAIQGAQARHHGGKLGKPIRMKSIALFPRPVSYFTRNDWAGRQKTAGGERYSTRPSTTPPPIIYTTCSTCWGARARQCASSKR